VVLAGIRMFSWRPGASREEIEQKRSAASIRQLVVTLGALKGAFVKAGQFAAVRLDLVPAEVRPALASLRDRVPARPFTEIRTVVEAELAAPLEARFETFEPDPIGAASIGQVHRATLLDGTPVAVKVQYPWLRRSLRADLAWLRLLLRLLGRRGRRFDGGRLFEEFARGMAEELDFEREAASARAIAENLAGEPQIVVPEVHAALSTGRVLTMTYHPCVPVTDAAGRARLGVTGVDVLALVARAYAKQVFVDGLFHADPHPGNLFVVDEAQAATRPRVLFVDFGLSRRLDPALRHEIRAAMYALLKRDPEAFLAGMQRMGMITQGFEGEVGAAVHTMFERLSGVDTPLGLGGAQVLSLKEEAKALLEDTRGVQLPNDLLLYARTMAYVFGLGQEIAPEADVMKLCLPPLLQFLAQKD
jgi:ubiquinone biosynthesis protein